MKKNIQQENFSTRILKKEYKRADVHGAISMPVYRNAAFEFVSSKDIADAFQFKALAHTYSRISNPTVENFEEKVKAASGAEFVMAMASGMAAISNTFLTIGYAGCNIVASPHLFGNTFVLLHSTLADFGIEARFVNLDNLEEVEAAIDENTCAFFCELITNPNLEIPNLPEIAKIAKAKNIPVIIDTTVVPWCGFDAKQAGIDIEVVSTTKYVSGGATSVGGVIVDYGTFDWTNNKKLARIKDIENKHLFNHKLRREVGRNIGAYMDPETAALQVLGLETLQLRYERMSQSAYELAQFLSEQSNIVSVNYPKLKSSRYHKLSEKLFTGNPGAMLTFNLKSKECCYQFMDNLKIIRRATNMFDNKSLIIHPESTIYGTFSPEMRKMTGVDETLLRLSVGLEDVNDLKTDIIRALDIL